MNAYRVSFYRLERTLAFGSEPLAHSSLCDFLGMFMVCVEFMGKNGRLLTNSCRSTMLHYRGMLLDTLYKLLYSPFFIIFGTVEEQQNVHVELFSDYEEQEVHLWKP